MARSKKDATAPELPDTLRLKIVYQKVDALHAYTGNPRTHSDKQISQIAASIRQFGFVNPVLVDDENTLIAGHGRLAAAKQLGISDVPTVCLAHLTEAERRALVIADNRLAELAGWDRDLLRVELRELDELELDFALETTGFETAELDQLLGGPNAARPEDDHQPDPPQQPVTRPGDVWQIGSHRLICGDATEAGVLTGLMGDERADMVFTDPPYNVPIDKHVCGSGKIKHREFAMASGEMSVPEFTDFLLRSAVQATSFSRDGSIHFICMDWRHMRELLEVGAAIYSELKNLIVWTKTNAGMGSFYRSQHELIFVFKHGTARHTNTFGLGDTGRYRSNVWSYPGVNSFGAGQGDLELHPTVKPTALVSDAIKDVSRRGDVVLDLFAGSGTTLIAAEGTRRSARLVELDPVYCDVIIARAQKRFGLEACLIATGQTFDEVKSERATANDREGS